MASTAPCDFDVEPVSAIDALFLHGHCLSDYEREEILDYREVRSSDWHRHHVVPGFLFFSYLRNGIENFRVEVIVLTYKPICSFAARPRTLATLATGDAARGRRSPPGASSTGHTVHSSQIVYRMLSHL
jgi:hypothetical protein